MKTPQFVESFTPFVILLSIVVLPLLVELTFEVSCEVVQKSDRKDLSLQTS